MADTHDQHTLPALVNDEQGRSVWRSCDWPTETRGGMVLSPRIGSTSLRLRTSGPGYAADWHVAGEPVLIIIQQGTLRIGLRDGSGRDFGPGDAFIAADALPDDAAFDPALHGHTAMVVGDQALHAIHIKLDPAGLNSPR